MLSNVKKGGTCRSLSWTKLKGLIVKNQIISNYFLFHLLLLRQRFFSTPEKMLKVIKIFATAHAYIWNRDSDFIS